jgi:hypothetical protein
MTELTALQFDSLVQELIRTGRETWDDGTSSGSTPETFDDFTRVMWTDDHHRQSCGATADEYRDALREAFQNL